MSCLKYKKYIPNICKYNELQETPPLKNYIKWGLLIIILLMRGIDIYQRTQLHPDEVYSVLLSQCNPAYSTSIECGTYTGSELKQTLTVSHPLMQDLRQLYINNADTPHASLYYMLLRLGLCGLDSWNPQSIALRGGILNLCLLSLTYLALWHLTHLLWRRKHTVWVSAATCAAAFLSPGAADCAMLVREYQLATLSIVLYVICIVKIYRRLALTLQRPHTALLLALTGSVALSLSSGYLNAYFLLITPIVCIVPLMLSTNRRVSMRFIITIVLCCLCGLLLALALYSGWFNFILHKNTHTAKAFEHINYAVRFGLKRDIIELGLTIPVAVFTAAIGLAGLITFIRKHNLRKAVSSPENMDVFLTVALIISSALTIMLVQYTSLLHEARYSFPFMPVLSLIIPLCLFRAFPAKLLQPLSVVIITYYLFLGYGQVPCRDFKWIEQRHTLAKGAVFKHLNPNEQIILYPVLTDTAHYTIDKEDFDMSSIDSIYTDQPVLTHNKITDLPKNITTADFNGPVKAVIKKSE